jgi:signal transduction histidine kinase
MPGSIDMHAARLPAIDDLEGGRALPDALRRLVSRQAAKTGADFECSFIGVDALRLARPVEEACYAVCREALQNAARHARARRITVELAVRHAKLVLRVGDDGEGFDPAQAPGAGLARIAGIVAAAGGRFELRSAPGAGTCVSALFPLPPG